MIMDNVGSWGVRILVSLGGRRAFSSAGFAGEASRPRDARRPSTSMLRSVFGERQKEAKRRAGNGHPN